MYYCLLGKVNIVSKRYCCFIFDNGKFKCLVIKMTQHFEWAQNTTPIHTCTYVFLSYLFDKAHCYLHKQWVIEV